MTEGRLVYVKVKSSPPPNLEEQDIAAFLSRVYALKPSLAIFLEDTRLRMKDKIIPIFESMLEGSDIKRVQGETFSIGERVFVTNSAPGLAANLSLCVKEHLAPKDFRD